MNYYNKQGVRMKIEIKAPCDQDGFALLQCHLCGEYFKLKEKM